MDRYLSKDITAYASLRWRIRRVHYMPQHGGERFLCGRTSGATALKAEDVSCRQCLEKLAATPRPGGVELVNEYESPSDGFTPRHWRREYSVVRMNGTRCTVDAEEDEAWFTHDTKYSCREHADGSCGSPDRVRQFENEQSSHAVRGYELGETEDDRDDLEELFV